MRVRRIILAGAAALLVLAIAGPATAAIRTSSVEGSPLPEVSAVQAQGPSTEVAQVRAEQLRERIEQILRVRKERFDRAEQRIAGHIEKVRVLADRVAAAGGDVSAAEAALARAEADLGEAAALEARAVEQFQAIPGAEDKRAAYKAAWETAKKAATELRSARRNVHEAVKLLREEIRELRSAGGSG